MPERPASSSQSSGAVESDIVAGSVLVCIGGDEEGAVVFDSAQSSSIVGKVDTVYQIYPTYQDIRNYLTSFCLPIGSR